MRRLLTAATTTLAACTAVVVTATPASAATGFADLAAYRLPSTATSQCVIGVTNNGPDSAYAAINPSDVEQKFFFHTFGLLAPGQSATVEFAGTCQGPSYDPFFGLSAVILPYTDPTPTDPNPLNNVVALPSAPTPGGQSPFGS